MNIARIASLAAVAVCFALQAPAATIGFCYLGAGAACVGSLSFTSNIGGAIATSGNTAQQLNGLSAADLAGINVLWILNPDNGAYASDLTGNLADVSAFVSGGGVLSFHDRFVTDAALVIPGAGSVTFVRDFFDNANEIGRAHV